MVAPLQVQVNVRTTERASERKRVCVRTRTDAASRSLLGASHLARSKAPPTLPCPAPAPLFLCLSVPLSVCTRPWRACLERVFHFGWFGWSRSAASTSAGAVQRASARQAFAFLHPSFLPSFLHLPPSSARPSLEKVSFNHWPPRRRFPHQPRLAMDGQSQTVTQWQPLSLVVKSLSLYNMVL